LVSAAAGVRVLGSYASATQDDTLNGSADHGEVLGDVAATNDDASLEAFGLVLVDGQVLSLNSPDQLGSSVFGVNAGTTRTIAWFEAVHTDLDYGGQQCATAYTHRPAIYIAYWG